MNFVKVTFAILLVSLATLSAGCSNDISTSSEFDPNFNFSTFRSFRWREANEFNRASRQYIADDLLDQRIRRNVEQGLLAKQIRLRETGPIDFLINYTVLTADLVNIETYNTYSGYAPGWQNGANGGGIAYSYGAEQSNTQVSEFTQGTLILDILDPQNDTLIWRGTAEAKLESSAGQRKREELVNEVVALILSEFPPPSR